MRALIITVMESLTRSYFFRQEQLLERSKINRMPMTVSLQHVARAIYINMIHIREI